MWCEMAFAAILLLTLLSESGSNYVDLSYDLHHGSIRWPTAIPFSLQENYKGLSEKGYWFESNNICLSEHTGTHLDAPAHLFKDRWHVDDIPLDKLMGPGVVVDIQEKVSKNSTAELTAEDLKNWVRDHGPLPDGVILFVRTGWGKRHGNMTQYFGTNKTDGSDLAFPGISLDAAKYITSQFATNGNRKVIGVGLDTASLDYGPSPQTYPAHIELFEYNIYGLENVANLEELPIKGFDVIVMPMKIRNGSGAPARILATIIGNAERLINSSVAINVAPILMLVILLFIVI